MDENVVVSETHYFTPKNCFNLNEPFKKVLLFYFICKFTYHLS